MQIETKKPVSIAFNKNVYKDLKVFAAMNDVTLNDAIKLLLESYAHQKGEK